MGDLVRVYPLRDGFIEGVPHIEQELPESEAQRLLRWGEGRHNREGTAFTTDPNHPHRLYPVIEPEPEVEIVPEATEPEVEIPVPFTPRFSRRVTPPEAASPIEATPEPPADNGE